MCCNRTTGRFAPLLALALLCGVPAAARAQAAAFPDAHEAPPAGWTGKVFKLSQDYPAAPPPAATYPWAAIDFKTSRKEYLKAVLDYIREGNEAVAWAGQDNAVRKWYHAPWMHWGPRGREFVRGLTRERDSDPGELHPLQTSKHQNWAVSLYNAPGGYAIGQVWKQPAAPDPAAAKFPVGTVAAKLLFTAAPDAEVPFLANSVAWQANINTALTGSARAPANVRLLQLDVAVRDDNAAETGWVFGTFVYQEQAGVANAFDKLQPVGLMWGNDPGVTPAQVAMGTMLRETWLNPAVTMPHYGWAGRLNGPVDNKRSSCLSCHSTAQIPATSGILPPAGGADAAKLRWFRNIRAGDPFDAGSVSTDYSLQLSQGIVRFKQSLLPAFAPAAAALAVRCAAPGPAADAEYERTAKDLDFDQPFVLDGHTYYPPTRGH